MKTILKTIAIILVGGVMLTSCRKNEPAVCNNVLGLTEYAHNNGVTGRDTVRFVGDLGDTESFSVTNIAGAWDRSCDDAECGIFSGGINYHKTEETIGEWGGIIFNYWINPKHRMRTTDTTWEGDVYIEYNEGGVMLSGLATIDANGSFIEKPYGDTLMFVRGDTTHHYSSRFIHADSVEVIRGVGVVSYFRLMNHSKYRLVRE